MPAKVAHGRGERTGWMKTKKKFSEPEEIWGNKEEVLERILRQMEVI